MGSGPVVSVIVTTRNSARTLENCLASVRNQTYPGIELIVVDNGSTDSTAAIAQRFADRVVDLGPERSAQRNHGATLARGAYLLFIDSDMILGEEVVADAMSRLEGSPAPAVIIPEESFGEGFWTRCRMLERSCYDGDDDVEAARLFRREVFEELGGFDLALTGPEDWDLTRRAARGDRLPRSAALIRHDEGRTTLRGAYRKRRYYAPGYLRYLRKHGRSVLKQGSAVFRPAFVRHWRDLARHPVLTAGVVSLKAVETAAVVQVAAAQRVGELRARRDGAAPPAPPGPAVASRPDGRFGQPG